jgi:hypothetical protein
LPCSFDSSGSGSKKTVIGKKHGKNSSSLRNADGRITGKKTILWYILKLLHDAYKKIYK